MVPFQHFFIVLLASKARYTLQNKAKKSKEKKWNKRGPWVAWPGFDARCHQTPSEYTRSTCLLNQWVRSLVGLITSAGTGEYFTPLQFTCSNCGGGDKDRVAIYRPFGEFRRVKSYCHLYGAQGQRQAYLLPMPR
ncbi:hypothetical protein TNCV_3561331 [Trichonephila clavipes]|nr:hypothetical protein TNCV_3561331 [Trichonephila clavipes]